MHRTVCRTCEKWYIGITLTIANFTVVLSHPPCTAPHSELALNSTEPFIWGICPILKSEMKTNGGKAKRTHAQVSKWFGRMTAFRWRTVRAALSVCIYGCMYVSINVCFHGYWCMENSVLPGEYFTAFNCIYTWAPTAFSAPQWITLICNIFIS